MARRRLHVTGTDVLTPAATLSAGQRNFRPLGTTLSANQFRLRATQYAYRWPGAAPASTPSPRGRVRQYRAMAVPARMKTVRLQRRALDTDGNSRRPRSSLANRDGADAWNGHSQDRQACPKGVTRKCPLTVYRLTEVPDLSAPTAPRRIQLPRGYP
jgi:hypothetical protein